MNLRYILFPFLLVIQTALANDVNVTDQRCVHSSLNEAVQAVTNYTGYSKLSGAALSLLGMNVLKMTKSQEIQKDPSSHNDSIVYIELRPLNFGEDKKALFPHFFIRCELTMTGPNKAQHECHWLTASDLSDYERPGASPQGFGLADFHSTLEIDANSGQCPAGQTHLSYQLVMQANDQDVSTIQRASGFSAFPLPEDQFFHAYYENFYQSWATSIEGSH
jgi:hypothetical protein